MKAKVIKLNKRSYVGGSVCIRQCSIYDDVEILGHVFHGLEDIDEHVEMWLGSYSDKAMKEEPKKSCKVHVGAMLVRYPCFDADDYAYEHRAYWNYVFRDRPISQSDMRQLSKLTCGPNECRIRENMPSGMLPMVYYGRATSCWWQRKNKKVDGNL